MLDLSLAGLLGAMAGTAVAAVCYGPLVTVVERGFRARGQPQTVEQRAAFGQELAVLRRAVLAIDILLFAGLGYWLGTLVEG
jgi:glycerol uptake facilitator-like aquaporin